MKTRSILDTHFYHDGRGPELQKVIWGNKGVTLVGFEFYNPDDIYEEKNIKNIELVKVEVFALASEEVHGNILAIAESQAAIFEVLDSNWIKTFQPRHLSKCKHFQIMFYDEIYEVICEDIVPGFGSLHTE